MDTADLGRRRAGQRRGRSCPRSCRSGSRPRAGPSLRRLRSRCPAAAPAERVGRDPVRPREPPRGHRRARVVDVRLVDRLLASGGLKVHDPANESPRTQLPGRVRSQVAVHRRRRPYRRCLPRSFARSASRRPKASPRPALWCRPSRVVCRPGTAVWHRRAPVRGTTSFPGRAKIPGEIEVQPLAVLEEIGVAVLVSVPATSAARCSRKLPPSRAAPSRPGTGHGSTML